MAWAKHELRVGTHTLSADETPQSADLRRHIEPWLSAVLQSEHLTLLVGSGLTLGLAQAGGTAAAGMATRPFAGDETSLTQAINTHALETASRIGRGTANIEDQIRSALTLLGGLEVLQDDRSGAVRTTLDLFLVDFLRSILTTEQRLRTILETDSLESLRIQQLLVSFLLTFASRTASRERLNLFTLNYERVIEYGCDLAGLRVLDRFVGILSPVFRSSRAEIDVHYNPPGIRGEPRYLEGVIRFGKLHGSIDWRADSGDIRRIALPFGADGNHPALPHAPTNIVMVYPNPAKDIETFDYPYAELHRDFAAAACRPQSALVTYGYGFGDDHINRVLNHMLTIPSTHLVIISFDSAEGRIERFWNKAGRPAQISLLIGEHFGALGTLVDHYLPKPAIDPIYKRKAALELTRGEREPTTINSPGEPYDLAD